jgi:hypothetical protein
MKIINLFLFLILLLASCQNSSQQLELVQEQSISQPTEQPTVQPIEPINVQQKEQPIIQEIQTQETQQQPIDSISLTELKQHSSELDCWVAFEGKVYDITQYLPKHPTQISYYCGTSKGFEDAFTAKHGSSKVSLLLEQGTYKGTLIE